MFAKQRESGHFGVSYVFLWDVYVVGVVLLWQETAVTVSQARV